jgi:hypothetical protein
MGTARLKMANHLHHSNHDWPNKKQGSSSQIIIPVSCFRFYLVPYNCCCLCDKFKVCPWFLVILHNVKTSEEILSIVGGSAFHNML